MDEDEGKSKKKEACSGGILIIPFMIFYDV